MAKLRCIAALAALLLTAAPLLRADAHFDLTGPPIDVRVTRSGVTLPIDSVPNLQPGDKLWVHPDLPESQSVKYLLVVAFLRGTTNPPPESWFTRIETWDKHVKDEGATVIVPDEAQQVLLFLAPVTGGDFATLRSAVQGRPGIFVRASQDLNAAGFEQGRIEKYISSIKQVPPSDPKALLEHSNLLAATLSLRPNEDCFKHPVDQQPTCLMQTGNQTLLDDGHAETVVSQLSNGPGSDLINSASGTQLAGGGLYSAYVGTIIDLARLLSGLHTAKYQYIPAIAFPQGQSLNLRLNTPPSFLNPKSVIVIGLPAVQSTASPPLRPSDPKQVTCLLRPRAALTVEGAPLVFSTNFAHDLVLHLNTPQPTPDIPLTADAFQGGLVLSPGEQRHQLSENGTTLSVTPGTAPKPSPDGQLTGTVYGMWGFDRFTGPTLNIQNVPGQGWRLAGDEPVVAGKDQRLEIASTGTACVESVSAETAAKKTLKTAWKRDNDSGHLDVTLRATDPSALHLAIHQYGQHDPETVATQALPEAAALAALVIHAGDTTVTLRGARLDQVKQVELNGAVFTPKPPAPSTDDSDAQLTLVSTARAGALQPGEKLTAKVALKDGRTLPIAATVAAARPSVTLLHRDIPQSSGSLIQLAGQDDLPLDQSLSFSLQSAGPFSRQEQIEIASPDSSLHTILSIADGTLVLQDPHTVVASLDPLKSFGASAFGPLQMRAVSPDGSAGDWQPLVTLVRLPVLSTLSCPDDPALACTLTGSNLYLIAAISASPDLSAPAGVPEGFLGSSIQVPHPAAGSSTLYLRLRDDPASADPATFPAPYSPASANSPATE